MHIRIGITVARGANRLEHELMAAGRVLHPGHVAEMLAQALLVEVGPGHFADQRGQAGVRHAVHEADAVDADGERPERDPALTTP